MHAAHPPTVARSRQHVHRRLDTPQVPHALPERSQVGVRPRPAAVVAAAAEVGGPLDRDCRAVRRCPGVCRGGSGPGRGLVPCSGTRRQLREDVFDGAREGDGFVRGDLDLPFEVGDGGVLLGEGGRWPGCREGLEGGRRLDDVSRWHRGVCWGEASRWLDTYTHGEKDGGERS
jgi:hypothetical protein